MKQTTRFLRFGAVREITGLSRSTIDRLEKKGEFPERRRISANSVAWVAHEVEGWAETRASSAAR